MRERLAYIVASHADRNYLIACTSAFQLAEDDTVVYLLLPDSNPLERRAALAKH